MSLKHKSLEIDVLKGTLKSPCLVKEAMLLCGGFKIYQLENTLQQSSFLDERQKIMMRALIMRSEYIDLSINFSINILSILEQNA